MFGLKKHPNEPQKNSDQPTHDIGVIPDIFYGGNDPEIYNEKEKEGVKKEISALKKVPTSVVEKPPVATAHVPPRRTLPPPLPPAQNNNLPPASAASVGLTQPLPPSGRSKKFLIFALLLVVFLAGGTAVWFFVFKKPVQKPVVEAPPVETPIENSLPVEVPPVETVTSTVTSTEIQPPIFSTSSISRERSLPQFSLVSPIDTDNDKLSEAEEEIFQTDPEVFDTDSDGYFDGQEVFNLYNPKGIAPMKIIDSGLVQEYVNPTFQYRLYYPTSWVATAIDERDNKDVLLSTFSGDYIQVKAYDKTVGETFPGWFGRVVGDQIYSDIVSSTNRFSVPFYRRKDGLVSYFDTPNQVYIVILYSRDEDKNNWPHVMDMVVQSFRTGRVNAELPAQIVVPTPGVIPTTTIPISPVSPPEGTPSSSVR